MAPTEPDPLVLAEKLIDVHFGCVDNADGSGSFLRDIETDLTRKKLLRLIEDHYRGSSPLTTEPAGIAAVTSLAIKLVTDRALDNRIISIINQAEYYKPVQQQDSDAARLADAGYLASEYYKPVQQQDSLLRNAQTLSAAKEARRFRERKRIAYIIGPMIVLMLCVLVIIMLENMA